MPVAQGNYLERHHEDAVRPADMVHPFREIHHHAQLPIRSICLYIPFEPDCLGGNNCHHCIMIVCHMNGGDSNALRTRSSFALLATTHLVIRSCIGQSFYCYEFLVIHWPYIKTLL